MNEARRKQRFVLGIIAVACLFGGAASVVVGCRDSGREKKGNDTATGQEATKDASASLIDPPAAVPTTRYVGSAACAECHADIAERYTTTHSMARAMQPVSEALVIENAEVDGAASFSTDGGCTYTVARFDGQLTHAETQHDAGGRSLFNQTESIAYVLGSGRRGRGYIIDREGLLFQSPISWYTQDDEYDLSPGYPASGHMRFDRKVSQECLFCHAGQVKLADAHNDRFAEQAIVEGGISCERCHGPGEQHVREERGEGEKRAKKEARRVSEGTLTRGVSQDSNTRGASEDAHYIVNPAKLAPAAREAVCYQCHLRSHHIFTRYGREYSDFRPGQKLDDIWTAFVSRDATNTPTLVEQVRASQCFLKSNGELGCISCHDPHERPAPKTRADFYRQRCDKCHADRGCSLSIEKQQAAPAQGSCIACHMPPSPTRGIPHTALTDHRILRDPSLTPATFEEGETPVESLVLFDDAAERLPKAEIDRAWGILLATRAGNARDVGMAERAIDFLNPDRDDPLRGMKRLESDAPALIKLGLAYIVTGRNEFAAEAWRRALKLEPGNEQILQSLTHGYLLQGDPQEGLDFADRLIAANPHMAEYHWLRATLLERLGRMLEAVQAAERALAHDPTALPIRQWLVGAYRKTNQPVKANEQQDFVDRWPQDQNQPKKSDNR